MIPALPAPFLGAPIAHRALHDVANGRPENSRAAVRAAVAAGYGIEIDLQLTADGQAVVFHDYDLSRLTGRAGAVRQMDLSDLTQIPLSGGDGETIPTLTEILSLVAGKVPLLVELKDQDGGMGPDIDVLGAVTARALSGYAGPLAVMSFNPHSVIEMARLLPDVPRGLVTDRFDPAIWPLPETTCARLREIPDFDRAEASFVSHNVNDLNRPRVLDLKAQGVPLLCWTVRSPEIEAQARQVADNVTFEGYAAPIAA